MLSRVAENIYWLARYIERAENTARLVSVNANLLLDLPRGMAPGWEPLITILGASDAFKTHHKAYGERQVVSFLLGSNGYSGSIVSSLYYARENARTIRDIIPREAWEVLNELHLQACDRLHEGLTKRGRHGYLKDIILGVQTLTGLLAGSMNHDQSYHFLRIGRNLERADMTTRLVDVRSSDLLGNEKTELSPFETIQWISILESLTAYRMYRRSVQTQVRRHKALKFLFLSKEFPRAVLHCANVVEACIADLPRNAAPLRVLGRLKRTLEGGGVEHLDQATIHAFIDELQMDLAKLHDEIAVTWFLSSSADTSE